MGDVAREGRTVLFVSHNMTAVKNLCEKAIYLDRGAMASEGETEKIVSEYLSKYRSARSYDSRFENQFACDDYVRITRVRFINSDNETVNSLVVNKAFGVEIHYEILQANAFKPTPTLYIKTVGGDGVFHALETQRDGIFNKGKYTSVAWIPANLINDGLFTLVIGMATLNPAYNHCQVEIEFEVEDDINALTRGDYRLRMHGTTRPLLNWDTRCVTSG
jgi:lipopolysaccharide transport system ATP-binding protein